MSDALFIFLHSHSEYQRGIPKIIMTNVEEEIREKDLSLKKQNPTGSVSLNTEKNTNTALHNTNIYQRCTMIQSSMKETKHHIQLDFCLWSGIGMNKGIAKFDHRASENGAIRFGVPLMRSSHQIHSTQMCHFGFSATYKRIRSRERSVNWKRSNAYHLTGSSTEKPK